MARLLRAGRFWAHLSITIAGSLIGFQRDPYNMSSRLVESRKEAPDRWVSACQIFMKSSSRNPRISRLIYLSPSMYDRTFSAPKNVSYYILRISSLDPHTVCIHSPLSYFISTSTTMATHDQQLKGFHKMVVPMPWARQNTQHDIKKKPIAHRWSNLGSECQLLCLCVC